MTASQGRARFGFNPVFTQAQFDRCARAKLANAASLYDCALAALACSAEGGTWTLSAANLDIVAQATKTLSLLYRAACADERVDEHAIRTALNALFWPIIAAAACCLERNDSDCFVEWPRWIGSARRLAIALIDIANSGCAKGKAFDDMIAELEALAFAAAALHEWLEKGIASLERTDVEDLSIARDADRLAVYLFNVVEQLKSGRSDSVETRAAA